METGNPHGIERSYGLVRLVFRIRIPDRSPHFHHRYQSTPSPGFARRSVRSGIQIGSRRTSSVGFVSITGVRGVENQRKDSSHKPR